MSIKKIISNKKMIVLIIVAAAVLMTAVIGTVAYVVTNTADIKNVFQPSNVACKVSETFDGSSKTDVKVQNTGNTDAYIRASVIVTWQDGNGNIYGAVPIAETDYIITQTASGWTQQGGYWYYNSAVAPEGYTSNLIDSVVPVDGKAPDGYFLSVEILAQAIQAEPADVITETWGYTPPSSN